CRVKAPADAAGAEDACSRPLKRLSAHHPGFSTRKLRMNLLKIAQFGTIAVIAAASLTACHKRDETATDTSTSSTTTTTTTTPSPSGTAGTSGTFSGSTTNSTTSPGMAPSPASAASR